MVHDDPQHPRFRAVLPPGLQPGPHHLPVTRYVEPAVFDEYSRAAHEMGFVHAACGPLVRSSYHADQQAHEAGVV